MKYKFKEPPKPQGSGGARFLLFFLICLAITAGILYWIKSCSGGEVAPEVENVTVPEEVLPPPPPPPPPTKYRKISENALFGMPLKYEGAVNGEIRELPLSRNAGTGILVDLDTRQVLWAKNPESGVPVASMVKMMTLLLAFEDMEERSDLNLDTVIQVTNEASKIGGSQVYLDPRESFPLGELMKSVVIHSANDSAYLMAEYLSGGNVPEFVARMNRRAAEIGMKNTKYTNPNGLNDRNREDSRASAEGQVFLAERLLEYPPMLEWGATRRAPFREPGSKGWQDMTNTNKLVGSCAGVDGMKTGYIQKSGFCLTVSCLRGNKRLIGVVTGFQSSKERDTFVRALLDWGYSRAAGL